MTEEEQQELLMDMKEGFGLTKHDFEINDEGRKVPIYTKWGADEDGNVVEENIVDLADLKNLSLSISKNLGDIYIDKISTDEYIVVGIGTNLHCDDIHAGKKIVRDFEGYLR